MFKMPMVYKPKLVLEFAHGIKVHLEGTTAFWEPYIEAPLYVKTTNPNQTQLNNNEHMKRMICFTVKKVTGFSVNDDNKEFECTFKDDTNAELDEYSYHVINRLFEYHLKESLFNPVLKHYEANKIPKESLVQIDTKKKTKSK